MWNEVTWYSINRDHLHFIGYIDSTYTKRYLLNHASQIRKYRFHTQVLSRTFDTIQVIHMEPGVLLFHRDESFAFHWLITHIRNEIFWIMQVKYKSIFFIHKLSHTSETMQVLHMELSVLLFNRAESLNFIVYIDSAYTKRHILDHVSQIRKYRFWAQMLSRTSETIQVIHIERHVLLFLRKEPFAFLWIY